METGESVAVGGLPEELKEKCPYKETSTGADDEDEEGLPEDDLDARQADQANNGGTLGDNLLAGQAGVGGTEDAPSFKSAPLDTKRAADRPQLVIGTDQIKEDQYPFTVAAHHLIPGNASLGRSKVYDYLGPVGSGKLKGGDGVRKRKEVSAEFGGKSRQVEFAKHIGYNVNGSHNGVWLPGNYAIRTHESPGSASWGKLDDEFDDWKFNYVAAAVRAAGGQFHDAHVDYSDNVLGLLNKIALALGDHFFSDCPDCKEPKKKFSPPFAIKKRLYAVSGFLREKWRVATSALLKSGTRPITGGS